MFVVVWLFADRICGFEGGFLGILENGGGGRGVGRGAWFILISGSTKRG